MKGTLFSDVGSRLDLRRLVMRMDVKVRGASHGPPTSKITLFIYLHTGVYRWFRYIRSRFRHMHTWASWLLALAGYRLGIPNVDGWGDTIATPELQIQHQMCLNIWGR